MISSLPAPRRRSVSAAGRWWAACLVAVGALLAGAAPASAQDPLYLVDDETTVRRVSFRFLDAPTFGEARLRRQIATKAPGFTDRLRDWFDVLPGITSRSFSFDPITLQKDVVRLRRFYNQNGFLQPRIDYPASQYDSTSNSIHVIFAIREGPPLIIQSADFYRPDSTARAATQFAAPMRERWAAFRDRNGLQAGERYTEFNRIRLEEEVQSWLRNEGYAFAQVRSSARVDSSANTAAIRFFVDPGPRGRFSNVIVEGNRSVSLQTVLRELPFQPGDLFSAEKVTEGQKQLFGLSLFRVALADIPEQPRDSTVTVRYRVREAKPRTVSGQLGYGVQTGLSTEGTWTHRNFSGDARTLTVRALAETGLLRAAESFPGLQPNAGRISRRFRTSVLFEQPYFFDPRLSATVEPFAEESLNPQFENAEGRFLNLNERQFGVTSTLLYEPLPFRTVSLQHTLSRTEHFAAQSTAGTGPALPAPPTGEGPLPLPSFTTGDDLFDKSILSLSATLGRADNYINPERGLLVRPSLRLGGTLQSNLFGSDIEFAEAGAEVAGYLPVSETAELAGRVFARRTWPLGSTRAAFRAPPADLDGALDAATLENRFDDYALYAGGGTDVRGWPPQQGGPKFLREPSTQLSGARAVYEPVGGLVKTGGTVEVRLPFPGLGASWGTALFADAAYIGSAGLRLAPQIDFYEQTAGTPAISSPPDQWLVGTGGGIRYNTPFGFLRLDLAVKLTPDRLDLRRPETVRDELGVPGTTIEDVSKPELRFFGLGTGLPLRLFRLHFGIGRSF